MKITDPIIELLAIKLYEHDHQDGRWPPIGGSRLDNWMKTCEEDRKIYRDMARGKDPIPDNE